MAQNITEKTIIGTVIMKEPKTVDIFLKYGLRCIGCAVASSETIAQGAKAHGMPAKRLKDLIAELNAAIAKDE